MKPSLQLKLGHQLTMTHQLQQAIRMLQLSHMALGLEIQATLNSNTMLEQVEGEALETEGSPESEANSELEKSAGTTEKQEQADLEGSWDQSLYTEFSGLSSTIKSKSDFKNKEYDFENQSIKEVSLKDHLLWQLEMSPFSERDYAIGTYLIDAIQDDGYLSITLEDLQKSLNEKMTEAFFELKEIEIVLRRIQQFDPVGVAARSLPECLGLQLKALPRNTPYWAETKRLIDHYLELVGKKQYTVLRSKLKISETDLKQALQLLTSLNPKPGNSVGTKKADYLIPDLIVQKQQNQWVVNLNPQVTARLRINPSYAALVRRADNSRDNQFLREQLNEARWFLKSLQNRHETLLRVAHCIVEKQKDFLALGEAGMRPLILHDIASELQLHESTISRITTQKYMLTPRGIFELKFFFSSHLTNTRGEDCSSIAVQAIIKKLIAEEPQNKPFSDHKIAELLAKEGIQIARRTIAKYRESMGILASHERKCYI